MKTLTAFYDLAYGPVSYDFVTWLVRARHAMRSYPYDCDALHVVIVPKEDGLGGFARHWGEHDESATRWRLWHIVVASCPLAGASVTVASSREMAKTLQAAAAYSWWPDGKAHFMGPLVRLARDGQAIPRLKATPQAQRYIDTWLQGVDLPISTLTLRNQTTDPARNTNAEEWRRLGAWLHSRSYQVITLDDSNVALGKGRGFVELDPDLRLALYERAAINVIGNNGPQELLKFSDAPYLIVGLALSDGWKDHFRKYFHMEPGDQLPWAKPNQRLLYKQDSFDVMREALQAC